MKTVFFLSLVAAAVLAPASFAKEQAPGDDFMGNWALVLPSGHAAWLSLSRDEEKFKGEIWTVGSPNGITHLTLEGETLYFERKCAVGEPLYSGGPPTGKKRLVRYHATVAGDALALVMDRPMADGTVEKLPFTGKRMPPLPPQPDLSKVQFGEPITLFNGRDLTGWRLTNPKQKNGWKAVEGELVNETPKTSFDPFSPFGNLRTEGEFLNFNLKLEFKVPEGGNSGVYLCGRYEVQVVDRDSRMQGRQGVGSMFGRCVASENAGNPAGEWNTYDITFVDRHVTVILNGKKVIDNEPVLGATKGALSADDTVPGPLYLQGDHTSVRYRNIVLRPVLRE